MEKRGQRDNNVLVLFIINDKQIEAAAYCWKCVSGILQKEDQRLQQNH